MFSDWFNLHKKKHNKEQNWYTKSIGTLIRNDYELIFTHNVTDTRTGNLSIEKKQTVEIMDV